MLIEFLLLALTVFMLMHQLRAKEQRQRIALLAQYLRHYQIEQLMERLTQGYQRVLGEANLQRRATLWQQYTASEQALAEQVARLAEKFAQVKTEDARISRIPLLPYTNRWWPSSCFDFRHMLTIHARGLAEAVREGRAPQDRAYTLLAEILLLQHSCHWFCRSQAVASARLFTRYQTHHYQAIEACTPSTREAYRRLIGF